jgi:two-component system chemotaxis sensor kinase CheA
MNGRSEAAMTAAFLEELAERVRTVEENARALERDPAATPRYDLLHAAVRKIVEAAEAMGCSRLVTAGRALETMLRELRRPDGKPVPQGAAEAALAYVELMRHVPDWFVATGDDSGVDIDPFLTRLIGYHGYGGGGERSGRDDEWRAMMQAYLPEFLMELEEKIPRLDDLLLGLEENREDSTRLLEIYRIVHTLKGSAGVLGLEKAEELFHAAETALASARGAGKASHRLVADILLLNDLLRRLRVHLETDGSDVNLDMTDLVMSLEAFADAGDAAPPSTAPAPTAQSDGAVETGRGAVRVSVARLDEILDAAGELALIRGRFNRLEQRLTADGESGPWVETFRDLIADLNLAAGFLGETALRARMAPVGGLFGRFKRIVRDLARTLGKRVNVRMEGVDTELDRNVLEAVADPLLHLVRNAVDHGIETGDERTDAGKAAIGEILLSARQEGGSVLIEVVDDGRGIDPEAVVLSALTKGVVDAAAAARMGPTEKLGLIFAPGFSTRDAVTEISGRGIGMDVVKGAVEALGGRVDIDATPGEGTRLVIRLPLTLAVTPALIVDVDRSRYLIPLFMVREVVRVDRRLIVEREGVVWLAGEEDEATPLAPLRRMFGVDDRLAPLGEGEATVVVIAAGAGRAGIVVDRVERHVEALVKSLTPLTGIWSPPWFSGAALLDDGSVACALDMPRILDSLPADLGRAEKPAPLPAAPTVALLAIKETETRRYVVPMGRVKRVAVVFTGDVAVVDDRETVRIGDQRMPASRPAWVTGEAPPPFRDEMYAVVFAWQGGEVALLVNGLAGMTDGDAAAVEAADETGFREMYVGGRSVVALTPARIAESARTPRTPAQIDTVLGRVGRGGR